MGADILGNKAAEIWQVDKVVSFLEDLLSKEGRSLK